MTLAPPPLSAAATTGFAERLPGVSPDIFGEGDFRDLAAIAYADAGIVLPPAKAMLVFSRLAPLVRDTGSQTFRAYVERVQADPVERARTIEALTTNHTFFYREGHQFEHFARDVRPSLVRALHSGSPVRLWSAGCSSGEETWSLAMTMLGDERREGEALARGDLRILASDISPAVLGKARDARYSAKDVQALPEGLRRAWISTQGDAASIDEKARGLVRFRQLNLHGEWPMNRPFDVIFCRNVMIYFDRPTKERLVSRFARLLVPGGHLYIGHSERVTGDAEAVLRPVGPTVYRKVAS